MKLIGFFYQLIWRCGLPTKIQKVFLKTIEKDNDRF